MKKLIRFLLATCCFLLCCVQLFAQQSSDKQEESSNQFINPNSNDRSSPRETLQGFISTVASEQYETAARYLNLEKVPDQANEEEIVRTLQLLLDQGFILPYSRISDDSLGKTDDGLPPNIDQIGTFTVNGEIVEVLLEQTTTAKEQLIWQFSSKTVDHVINSEISDEIIIDKVLPEFLENNRFQGSPLGHWMAIILLAFVAYFLARVLIRIAGKLIQRFWKNSEIPVSRIINALVLPFELFAAAWIFAIITQEVGISIVLRQKFSLITSIVGILAILIFLWRITTQIGDFGKEKLVTLGNSSGVSIIIFLQRAIKVSIVVIGFIYILGFFGINVTAGLAALGIGGLALALGAQKTIENFVGSVTIIADQPIRVGDFCKVGDVLGTIDSIGIRSTRIRTLARTMVTIPNGEFSSTKIENYSARDLFWFHHIFNLRLETTPDQIRYLLVELRQILYAHPKVDPAPARFRYLNVGPSSINLEAFAYLKAVDYDNFLEIQEDLLLRMMDVIEKSGTSFAFPSQTLYFAKDKGLSKDKTEQAEETVKEWIENNELQIPQFNKDKIEHIKNSLTFPPKGSASKS